MCSTRYNTPIHPSVHNSSGGVRVIASMPVGNEVLSSNLPFKAAAFATKEADLSSMRKKNNFFFLFAEQKLILLAGDNSIQEIVRSIQLGY